MQKRVCKLIRMNPPEADVQGLLFVPGDTVPTDGTAGYEKGCIFQHTDGTGAGDVFYVNEGSVTSCDFNAVSALTATQEALIGATAGTAAASKAVILDANKHIDVVETASLKLGASGSTTAVTATAAELNQLDGNVLDDMTPGTGISTGTGTVYAASVVKVGSLYKTTIFIDVTGLHGGGDADDIIGVDGETANCHIGQITAAKNGTIVYGQITCLETPAGGDPDIDLYGSADEATGAQDAALTTLTGEEKLLDHGDWTAAAATPVALSALPDADGYMYLVQGAATDEAYSAGQFLIELWGV